MLREGPSSDAKQVAMLTSACLFGGEGTATRLSVSQKGFLVGGLCLFAVVTKSPSRSSHSAISAKAKMRCQSRVPFLVAQREAGKI